MQKALGLALAFSFGLARLAGAARAPAPAPLAAAGQDQESYQPYTGDQLDNLLAPIALYPDPLLAQVLIAATFPDQIDEASRWVRSYGPNGVDDQPWDVSVRAVAHYPTVLNMMDDNLDWTTALGQAYVYQSTDVMISVQRLRAMAQQEGNLVSTPQQQVVEENGGICIWPASPEYIYVPVYDPAIVYFRRAYSSGIFVGFSFGPAFSIGVWLNLDCDWGHHRVYYTGWQGRGWIERSRPHIRINPAYVNSRFSRINVNHGVTQRPVNSESLSRYASVHHDVNFQNRGRGAPMPARQPTSYVPNKIMDRNITPDQQFDQFRGRQQPAPAPRAMPQQPRRGTMQERPAPPPRSLPQASPPARVPVERPQAAQEPNAFGRGNGAFNTRAASQRGQQSREQMNKQPARQPAKNQPRGRRPGGR